MPRLVRRRRPHPVAHAGARRIQLRDERRAPPPLHGAVRKRAHPLCLSYHGVFDVAQLRQVLGRCGPKLAAVETDADDVHELLPLHGHC